MSLVRCGKYFNTIYEQISKQVVYFSTGSTDKNKLSSRFPDCFRFKSLKANNNAILGEYAALENELLKPWPRSVNPHTGEIGGPSGPEPTRYGDWERKGRVSDF